MNEATGAGMYYEETDSNISYAENNTVSLNSTLFLFRVPGHFSILGNEIADELDRKDNGTSWSQYCVTTPKIWS